MEDFSFIQITDHHLLESEEALRDGFCPGHAFRMVMWHISQNVADKVDFVISTGDLVEPEIDAHYRGAVKLLVILASPHYRYVHVHDGVLTSRVYKVVI